jgi:hypothetical protein
VFEYVLSDVRDGEKPSRKSWEKMGCVDVNRVFNHIAVQWISFRKGPISTVSTTGEASYRAHDALAGVLTRRGNAS